MMIFSILLAVLIFGKSGYIGNTLSEVFGGMMGIIKYILPIGIFAIAVKIACTDNEYLTSKLVKYGIFIISIAVLLSVFEISSGHLDPQKEFSEVIKDAYELGIQNKGGGALGATLAIPLVKLLGNVGAIILCIGIAVMLFVFTFIDFTKAVASSKDDAIKKATQNAIKRVIIAIIIFFLPILIEFLLSLFGIYSNCGIS